MDLSSVWGKGGISPWWIAASCATCVATLVIGLFALRRGDRSFGDAL